MKRRLVVGDIHGRWGVFKDIYDKENPDEVIVIGDYFDSFNIQPLDQKICYENIVALQEKHNSEKHNQFIMLIGNHDMHYLSDYMGQHSGYNRETESFAGYMIERDICTNKLIPAFLDKINHTIYSHAGVNNKWLKKWFDGNIIDFVYGAFDTYHYEKFKYHPFEFTYRDGGDWFGSSEYNGPTWIRPEGLLKDPYKDEYGVWDQIFGHTSSKEVKIYNIDNAHLYSIDCICHEYIIEEIDKNGKLINRNIVSNKNIVM